MIKTLMTTTIENADKVAPVSGLAGVTSTLVSLSPQISEYAQLITALGGVVGVSLAIYLYVLRIKEVKLKIKKNESKKG